MGSSWKATKVGKAAVSTTKELVSQIKGLKEKGATAVKVSFIVPQAEVKQKEPEKMIAAPANTSADIDMPDPYADLLGNNEISMDLTQPLGITFDEVLRAKAIQEGSQAAKLYIRQGSQVCKVEGKPVEKTTELVAIVKALKASGQTSVKLEFLKQGAS